MGMWIAGLIGFVVFVVVLWAVGSYGLPDLFTVVATPLAENGAAPFQMLQALALIIGAVFTLWLTLLRTEAANKNAEAALENIQQNQIQLDQFRQDRLNEQYREALEMMTGAHATTLSKTSGIRILRTIATQDPQAMYERVIYTLVDFVNLHRELVADEFFDAVIPSRQTDKTPQSAGPEFPELTESSRDVVLALTSLFNLRKTPDAKEIERTSQIQIFLRYINLRNMAFINYDLSDMIIDIAVMKNCKFENCDLSGSILSGLYGSSCEMIGCKVDNASIDLQGFWKIENNHHSEDAPPASFIPDELAYAEDISEGVRDIEQHYQRIKNSFKDEELKADFEKRRDRAANKVPKLIIRDQFDQIPDA